jgi:DNA-binding transcriptional LysR family regulator
LARANCVQIVPHPLGLLIRRHVGQVPHSIERAFPVRIEPAEQRVEALRDKPAGAVRLSAREHAADLILWPAVHKLLPQYPDIKVEIIIDNGLSDIVAERLDAGVRLGEQVAKDMAAVRIGPDLRMAVVVRPSTSKGGNPLARRRT